MHPVVALETAGVEMDVLGIDYERFTDSDSNAVVQAFPRTAKFKEDTLQAFYNGIKRKPETAFGDVKAKRSISAGANAIFDNIDSVCPEIWYLIFEGSNIHQRCDCSMPDSLRRFKADVFQALAHPTRIAIIELLQNGELSAGELMERLGMEQANVSQHLAVLRAKLIVVNRKAGNQVFYSVRDPIIIEVLALMRRYFQKQLKETQGLLDEMDSSLTAISSPSKGKRSPR